MLPLALLLSIMTPEDHLVEAKRSLDALEFDAAADEAMLIVTDRSSTEEQRFQANVLAGIANRIGGRDVDARMNFRYVLARRPQFRLPEWAPPKVVAYFELVRQEMEAERAREIRAMDIEPPAAPVPAAERARPPVGPLALLGVGGVVAAAGAATLAWAEVALGTPGPVQDRIPVLLAGRIAAVGAAVGFSTAVAGGVWWTVE